MLDTTMGSFWVEVKYIEDKSLFIFSTTGNHPSSEELVGWPFLIMIIGSPSFPEVDQLFLYWLVDLEIVFV